MALELEGGHAMQLKFEWVLEGLAQKFNTMTALTRLNAKLEEVDNKVHLRSSATSTEWKTAAELPVKEAFNHKFNVKQEMFGKTKTKVK
eukprot:1392460-Ditylum_brightwellii.AAC.1